MDGPKLYFAMGGGGPHDICQAVTMSPTPTQAKPLHALQDGPLRILCSYHYFKGVDMEELSAKFRHPPQIFSDSGGFSAFSQGISIDIDHYAWWLKRWRPFIHVAANLDDLHDPVVTWRNQKHLEAQGLNPIPVFHLGSHFDWLRKYLDAGYTYLALGKMVGRPLPAVMRWAVQCFKIAKPYGAVFHGFGLTRAEAIQALPFYSVDSSSWGSGHRFGRVVVWDADRRKFDAFNLWDRKAVARLGRHIRAAGYDPQVFVDKAKYHRSYAAGLSAVAWLQFEQHVRARHGLVPLPEAAAPFVNTARPGMDLYLAEGAVGNMVSADEGLHLYLAQGRPGGESSDPANLAAASHDVLDDQAKRIKARQARKGRSAGPNRHEVAPIGGGRDGDAGLSLYLASSHGGAFLHGEAGVDLYRTKKGNP